MTDGPDPAIAVSPDDQSSDRVQADADNASATDERAANRAQADLDQNETRDLLNTLIAESREVVNVSQTATDASVKATEANNTLALAMVEYQERARLAKRRYLITIVLIVLGFGGLYVRQEYSNANVIQGRNSSRAVLHQIADCLTPSGECAKRNAKNSAAFLATNQKIISLAAACAPDYVTLPLLQRVIAIETCVAKGLEK